MNPIQQQHSNLNLSEQVSNQIAVKIPTSRSFWIQLVSFIILFICYFLSLDSEQQYVQALYTYFYYCPQGQHFCKWIVMYPYLIAFALCFMLLAIFSRFKAQQLRWKADWMIIFDVLAIAFTFITIFLFLIFYELYESYGTFINPWLPILISLSTILQLGMVCFYDLKLRKEILVKNPQKLEIIYSNQLFLQLAAILLASTTLGLKLVRQRYQHNKYWKDQITLVTGQKYTDDYYYSDYINDYYNQDQLQIRFSSCFEDDLCNFVVVLPYMIGLFLFFTIIQIICRNQGKQVYGLCLLLNFISEILLIILVLMLIIFCISPIKDEDVYLVKSEGKEPSVYYYLDDYYKLTIQEINIAPIALLGFCGILQGFSVVYDYQQRIRELQNKQ